MAAFCRQDDRFAVVVHRLLRQRNRGRRLERHAEADRLAVGDAALNAAAVVRPGTHPAVLEHERIVVLRTRHARPGKAGTDLKSLGRRNRQHGPGQLGFHLFPFLVDLSLSIFSSAGIFQYFLKIY